MFLNSSFHSIGCRIAVLSVACVIVIPTTAADVVDDQSAYTSALNHYMDAQIELQAAEVSGLRELQSLGHASVAECQEAEQELASLKIRRKACDDYLQWLAEFEHQVNPDDDAASTSKLVVDSAQLLELPAGALAVVVLDLHDMPPELTDQLVDLNVRRRATELQGIDGRLQFLNHLIDRLNMVPNRLPGEETEVAQLRLQKKLMLAEIDLIENTPAAVRRVSGAPRLFRGKMLSNVQSQISLLTQEWQRTLLKAEFDVVTAKSNLRKEQRAQLAAIDAAGKGLPYELARSDAQLRQLDGIATGLLKADVTVNSALFQHMMHQDEKARRAAHQAQVTRTRLERVTRLAASDEFFTSERDWLTKRLKAQTAASRMMSSKSDRLHALHSDASADAQLVSTRHSVEPPANELPIATLLRAVLAGDLQDHRIENAQAELDLAVATAAAVKQLKAEGHASWREAATANMKVKFSEAELETRMIDREAADVYVQLIDLHEQELPELNGDSVTLRSSTSIVITHTHPSPQDSPCDL